MMVATKAPREEEMRNVTANVIPTVIGVLIEEAATTETEYKGSTHYRNCGGGGGVWLPILLYSHPLISQT